MTAAGNASAECLAALTSIDGVQVRRNLSAAALTTFCIGGPLAYVLEASGLEALQASLRLLHSFALPYRVLGAGSNLLIRDEGLDEWIIRLGRGFRAVSQVSSGVLTAGGAASLMSMSRDLSADGFAGLEFAGGIPASLAGAVRMNAGAHGGQMADIVEEVQVVNAEGQAAWIRSAELSFSYRRAEIPANSVITAARLRLQAADAADCAARRVGFLAARKASQPLSAPSAGSVFKNPCAENPAGRLLEQAGLKGVRCGGAHVSRLHANWILNQERRATAADVIKLMELCRLKVLQMFALDLEPEIVRW